MQQRRQHQRVFHIELLLLASLSSLLWCAGAASSTTNPLGVDEAQHPSPSPPAEYHEAYHRLPWLAPPSKQFPWEGSTDLATLAKAQGGAAGGTVTALVYSKPTSRWALNLIYSLVMLAKVQSYLVAVLDDASLADCRAWRLPCVDARWAMEQQQRADAAATSSGSQAASGGGGAAADGSSSQPAGFASARFHAINWAKIRVVLALLELGYHVHYSDTDVVYFRDAYASYETLFHVYRADSVFMREAPVNTGTWMVRATDRGRALIKAWLGAKPEADKASMSEQAALPLLRNQAFKFCYLREECDAYATSNMSTIFLHEMQNIHSACPEGPVRHHCHPDRLFMHAICMHYGQKAMWFDQEKFWMIDGFGQPRYSPFPRWASNGKRQQAHVRHLAAGEAAAGGAQQGALRAGNGTALRTHPFLPCATPAWTYMTRHHQR